MLSFGMDVAYDFGVRDDQCEAVWIDSDKDVSHLLVNVVSSGSAHIEPMVQSAPWQKQSEPLADLRQKE
jgi:hypothetical protein